LIDSQSATYCLSLRRGLHSLYAPANRARDKGVHERARIEANRARRNCPPQ
jgi:hypothetical protein